MISSKVKTTRVAALLLSAVLGLQPIVPESWMASACGQPPPRLDKEEPAEGRNVKVPAWRFTYVADGTSDMRGFDIQEARSYIADRCQELTPERALEVFRKYSFENLEHLAKQKAIDPGHSTQLAEFRRTMIETALADVIAGLDKGLTVGLLDSGNRNGGIGSDIDQTIIVQPKELADKLGFDEARVTELLNEKFEARWGFHPEHAGIETLNGRDFFPDWKQGHTVGWMINEYGRVASEKRPNKEAYHSEAMLKIQVEGRHREVIEAHNKRLAELILARDRMDNEIARIMADPNLDEASKLTQAEGLRKELLAQGEEVKRLSPWLEGAWDHSTDPPKPKTNWFADAKDRVSFNGGDLEKRLAFDGSWDNWVAAENHPQNRAKYLLRSTGEGVGLMRPSGQTKGFASTFKYEAAYEAGHHDLCQQFVDEVYRHLSGAERERVKQALDTASKQRIQHASKGAAYAPTEVWAEYIAELPEQARRTMPEASLIEAAMGRWQASAREILLDNILMSIEEPAKLFDGGLTPKELAEIRTRYPDASPKKLSAVVREQFYNAFHDLMSIEHAKALADSPDGRPAEGGRMTDVVDRLLARVAAVAPGLETELRAIAEDVALKRLATEPGQQKYRASNAFYDFAKESLKRKLAGPQEVYRNAKQILSGEKYSTPGELGRAMVESSFRRAAGLGTDVLGAAGFSGKVLLLGPRPGGALPALEIKWGEPKFDSKEAVCNMASVGNLDSVLQIMSAYQDGGADAAIWQATKEIVLNVPEIAVGAAVLEFLKTGNPQGLVMVGTAFLVPGAGQVYVLVSIATTSVKIAGAYVMEELGSDTAAMAYQGYLGPERGFVREQASRRFNVLSPVRISVANTTIVGSDGKTYSDYVVGDIFDEDEALDLEFREPGEDSSWMRKKHLLGAGPRWQQALAGINENTNPRAAFEARRLSLFYHYEHELKQLQQEKDFEFFYPDEALPHLQHWCLAKIDDYIHGRGDYQGIIGGEVELIQRRFTPSVRSKIAVRMANDVLRSYLIVRGDEFIKDSPKLNEPIFGKLGGGASIESGIRAAIVQERERKKRFDVNRQIVCLDEAWRRGPVPGLADAVYAAMQVRKLQARGPEPKIHLRARVMDIGHLKELEGFEDASAAPANSGRGGAVFDAQDGGPAAHFVECSVSVVADPELYPPPYRSQTLWDVRAQGEGRQVTARVTVYDAKNQKVGEASREIGSIGDTGKLGSGPIVRFNGLNYDRDYFGQRRSKFLQLAEPGDLRQLPPFKENPELFKDVYGLCFYRRFDKPQPDEQLRFHPGQYGGGFVVGNSDQDAVYLSPATSKTDVQKIGVFSWAGPDAYSPPQLEGFIDFNLRPMDPSDPRAPRWYAYSVLYYTQPAGRRFGPAEPKDLAESALSEWTRCELVPLLSYYPKDGGLTYVDPKQIRTINLGTDMQTPGLGVSAFLRLNGKLQVPEHYLDWREMLPDAHSHYIYRYELAGQERFAIFDGNDRNSRALEGGGRQILHQPPGTYPLKASIQLGNQLVVGNFHLVRSSDRDWQLCQKQLQEKLSDLPGNLARIEQNARSPSSTPGLRELSLADTHMSLTWGYQAVADFANAEKHALQAVQFWKQGAALYPGGRHLHKHFDHLADVYFAADQPEKYLAARQSEREPIRVLIAEYGHDGAMAMHWRDVAEQYFNMTGDLNAARGFLQKYVDAAPADQEKPSIPPEWWKDPRDYYHDPKLERAIPRVLDPDPLVGETDESDEPQGAATNRVAQSDSASKSPMTASPPVASAPVFQNPLLVQQTEKRTARAKQHLPQLQQALQSKDGNTRWGAAMALGDLAGAAATAAPALARSLGDVEPNVRVAAARALAQTANRDPQIVSALVDALADDSPVVRAASATALGEIGAKSSEVVDALLALQSDADQSVRLMVSKAVRRIDPKATRKPPRVTRDSPEPVDVDALIRLTASNPGTVPRLVGLTAADAGRVATAAGLGVKLHLGQPATSKELEYQVIQQKPEPGTRLSPRSEVQLLIYAKAESVSTTSVDTSLRVPELVGRNAIEARSALQAAGLKPHFVIGSFAPTPSQVHHVVSLDPPANTIVARSYGESGRL